MMRYLILSDIHANIEALDAVLAAAAADLGRVSCLGDLVGYGAEPNAVIERVPRARSRSRSSAATTTRRPAASRTAATSTRSRGSPPSWTYETLTPENRHLRASLPPGPEAIDEHIEICHGAPFDEDHYIFDAATRCGARGGEHRPLCLFGHTHLPVVFHYRTSFDGGRAEGDETSLPVDWTATRYLINVRVGRSAARRRSARRLRRLRRRDGGVVVPARAHDVEPRSEDHRPRAPRSLGEPPGARGSWLTGEWNGRGIMGIAVQLLWDCGRLRDSFAGDLAARPLLPLQLGARTRRAARDPRIQPITMPTISSTAG